jgi:HEAT repeat protein
MKSASLIILAACCLFMTGCPHARYAYTKPIDMPIDAALQADAVKEVQSALHSTDEVLRGNAIETLKDTHLPKADEQIVAALDDRSLFVRKAAAMAAGELRLKAALPKLQPLLDGDMGSTPQEATAADQQRMAAIFAMHRLGNTQYSQELVVDAADNRSVIRRDAAFIMGLLNEKSAIPILEQMLRRDADVNVRLEAGEALWRLGDEKGEDVLISATISAVASDQMIAALALAEPRDSRVLGHIESMFGSNIPDVDLVAARACGMLGSDEGYAYAVKGSDSKDLREQALAALAFGDIGRVDAQPHLKKLLASDNPNVRLAAAKALIEIAESHH